MADSPAYTTVPGKLPELMKRIRDTGVPTKANAAWLQGLGYKSSNDRSMLSVLKQIGFIDADRAPSPAWRQYRGSDHKEVLGRAIQVGYADLYQMYPDAQTRSNTDLGNFFGTKTTAGKQAIDKMIATFKNLVGLAEFDIAAPPAEMGVAEAPVVLQAPVITSTHRTGLNAVTRTGGALAVNINIALTLPETSDEKVFGAFFKAMREHLLSDRS